MKTLSEDLNISHHCLFVPQEPCTPTLPAAWRGEKTPAYCWQCYYLWANMEVLNYLRRAKGLNTFAFRPHAGETGDPMHLAATYMLCGSINHGINLDRQVSLQYLYYLDQVNFLGYMDGFNLLPHS
jgi:AMP deaminase